MGYVNRQTEWGNQRTDSFKVYLFAKEHQPSCWKVPFYYPLVRRSLHVFLKVSNDGFFLWNFLCPQSVYICLVLEYRHISVFDCIVNCLRFVRVFSLDMKFFESSRCWSCSCRLYVLATPINWSLQTFHRSHRPTSGGDLKHKQIVWQNFGQLAGMFGYQWFPMTELWSE